MKKHAHGVPTKISTFLGKFELLKTERSPNGVVINIELLIEKFFEQFDLRLVDIEDCESLISLTTRLAIEDGFWYPAPYDRTESQYYHIETCDLMELLVKYWEKTDVSDSTLLMWYINFIRDELEQRTGVLLSETDELIAEIVFGNVRAIYRKRV